MSGVILYLECGHLASTAFTAPFAAPGSSKTTLATHFAQTRCEKGLENGGRVPIPEHFMIMHVEQELKSAFL